VGPTRWTAPASRADSTPNRPVLLVKIGRVLAVGRVDRLEFAISRSSHSENLEYSNHLLQIVTAAAFGKSKRRGLWYYAGAALDRSRQKSLVVLRSRRNRINPQDRQGRRPTLWQWCRARWRTSSWLAC